MLLRSLCELSLPVATMLCWLRRRASNSRECIVGAVGVVEAVARDRSGVVTAAVGWRMIALRPPRREGS